MPRGFCHHLLQPAWRVLILLLSLCLSVSLPAEGRGAGAQVGLHPLMGTPSPTVDLRPQQPSQPGQGQPLGLAGGAQNCRGLGGRW